jgi:hypothetical protein
VPEDSADGVGQRPDSGVTRGRSTRTVTPAIAGALVVLAASFVLSVAFVLANGGMDLPAAQRPSPTAAAAAVIPSATALGVATTAPAESAAPSRSPQPSVSATATPEATARPTPRPTARPSSNRYDLLTQCPTTPDCWIYVVRQGDNLFSIARYFGVSLKVVEDRNPWTATTPLVAGQKLLLPTPTR